jgi:hypothetical protein
VLALLHRLFQLLLVIAEQGMDFMMRFVADRVDLRTELLARSVRILVDQRLNPVVVQQPSARQQLQHIHTPQSIDQELVRLTKDLELTPEQQQQVRPLLEEHHNRIQTLVDKNPDASRQELGPQIHAISDETHREIHALLSDHQKQLEKAMQQREHRGEENRRPAPPTTASPQPSASAS